MEGRNRNDRMSAEQYDEEKLEHQFPVSAISEWQEWNDLALAIQWEEFDWTKTFRFEPELGTDKESRLERNVSELMMGIT